MRATEGVLWCSAQPTLEGGKRVSCNRTLSLFQMIDIDTQMKCLKLAWVNRYFKKNNEENACVQILHHGIPVVNTLKNTFWFCNLKDSDLKKIHTPGV